MPAPTAARSPPREPPAPARERAGGPGRPGPDRKEEEKEEKTETEAETAPPPLTWWAAARTWKGEDLVDFRRHALPPDRGVPRVVVMDNASFHHRAEGEGRPARPAQAESPFVLPAAHGPELNDIERLFRKAKHEAMPRRLQPHERALLAAVHACFRDLLDQLSS